MSVSGAKPFSLQAPEAIAKQYQGNKQKIAQAVQLGLVDATAGTLAGMFIDRMRAAAMQEQGPPQTVAQQVLGSNPPAPPPGGPPMAPMAGGAPPPPMPMPMPQGAPPANSAAPMGGPPVQAAEGGLMALPVPDTMFDEPEDTSMARGGLVAFAGSGSTNAPLDAASRDEEEEEIPFIDRTIIYDFLNKKSPQGVARDAAAAKAKANVPNALKAIAENTRAPAPSFAALTAAVGTIDLRNNPNGRRPKPGEIYISTDGRTYKQPAAEAPPAPRTNAPRTGGGLPSLISNKSDKAAADKAAATPPTAPTTVAEDLKMIQGLMQDPETKAYMEGQTARLAKQKKEDVWSTLAQIGFGMAASKSPTLLGAIGEAGTAALPTAQKAIQARRAAEADFAKQRMEQRGRDVTTALGYNQNAEQVSLKREEMSQKERQFEAQLQQAYELAEMSRATTMGAARLNVEAANKRETDFKFAVRSLAVNLLKSDPQKYPTMEAALAEAVTQYIAPKQQGQSLAEAMGEDGGGRGRSAIPAGAVQKIG